MYTTLYMLVSIISVTVTPREIDTQLWSALSFWLCIYSNKLWTSWTLCHCCDILWSYLWSYSFMWVRENNFNVYFTFYYRVHLDVLCTYCRWHIIYYNIFSYLWNPVTGACSQNIAHSFILNPIKIQTCTFKIFILERRGDENVEDVTNKKLFKKHYYRHQSYLWLACHIYNFCDCCTIWFYRDGINDICCSTEFKHWGPLSPLYTTCI